MPYNTNSINIIVTGFSNDNKTTPGSKEKKTAQLLKKEKKNLSNLIEDKDTTFENRVANFKKATSLRLRKVETRMDRLRRRMETTTKEFKDIYQDQAHELEQTIKKLNGMLKNHKKEDENEWEAYRQLFNDDLDKFEKMLSGFLDNFKTKQASANYYKNVKKL